MSSHSRRGNHLSGASFIRSLILLIRLCLHDLIISPQTPPPNTIISGIRITTYEFGMHTNILPTAGPFQLSLVKHKKVQVVRVEGETILKEKNEWFRIFVSQGSNLNCLRPSFHIPSFQICTYFSFPEIGILGQSENK